MHVALLTTTTGIRMTDTPADGNLVTPITAPGGVPGGAPVITRGSAQDSAAPTTPPPPPGGDEEEVVATAIRNLRQADIFSKEWRDEAKVLYDLNAGKQWDDADVSALRDKYQGSYPMVTFNVAGKYIDAVTGLQINNRQEVRYLPRNVGDASVDDYATGVYKWNRDQCNAEDEESDAFRDLVLTGMGWVEHFYDDTEDADGFIAQERRDPIEMFWDPRSRRNNLSDRQWQARIKPMSRDEYRLEFGEDPPGGDESAIGRGDDPSSPQIISMPHDYGDSTGGSQLSNQCYVIDYQYWILEDAVHVKADFGDGVQSQTMEPGKWSSMKQNMVSMGVQHTETPLKVKRYYRAKIAGNKIKGGIRPITCGAFTFECMTGKRDRNKNTWFGIGRAMLDPNRWVNKFFSSILYTLMTNAKGGLMAEEGTFEDDRKAEQSWSNPASITKVTTGAISGGRIMPKPQAQYPQGMDRLMTFSLDALPLTTGLNPEILGLANREQAGVLESQRKQAALAIISWAFDAMRRYHKRSGRLMLDMIRMYLPKDRLIRIDTKQGPQYAPMLLDKMTAEYDIIVDESPTAVNMQERTWAFLKEVIPMSKEMGVPIPPSVLQFAPIPGQLQQDWMKLLQPDPEMIALKKRQQEAEVAGLEAKAKQVNAQAEEAMARPQLKELEHRIQALSDANMGHVSQLNSAHSDATKQLIAEMQRDTAETVAALNAAVALIKDSKQEAAASSETQTPSAPVQQPSDGDMFQEAAALAGAMERLASVMQEIRKPRDIIYDENGNVVRIQ